MNKSSIFSNDFFHNSNYEPFKSFKKKICRGQKKHSFIHSCSKADKKSMSSMMQHLDPAIWTVLSKLLNHFTKLNNV